MAVFPPVLIKIWLCRSKKQQTGKPFEENDVFLFSKPCLIAAVIALVSIIGCGRNHC